MRAFAMTGMVTAALILTIISGSDMRATPPSLRMSAGTRSRAMTAQAPASSAILACSASVTSMMTPPLSISARPVLTLSVPMSFIAGPYCGSWQPSASFVRLNVPSERPLERTPGDSRPDE